MRPAIFTIAILLFQNILIAQNDFPKLDNPFEPLPTSKAESLEKSYTLSGNKPLVLMKEDLNDFTGTKDRAIADFDDERKAEEAADALNKALKGNDVYKWMYAVRKRTDKPSKDVSGVGANVGVIRGNSKITPTSPKFVDPGPSASLRNGSDLASRLIGKKFDGVIGLIDVTFNFIDESKVQIKTSSRTLDATWEVGADGRITIKADNATFIGSLNGDTVSGTWNPKNPAISATNWKFTIPELKPGKAYNPPTLQNTFLQPTPKAPPIKEIQFRMYFIDFSGRREHEWRDRDSALKKLDEWFPAGSLDFKGVKEAGVEDSEGKNIIKRTR